MTGLESAEDRLTDLRDLISEARAMPMSASCVINRSDVLAAIDHVIEYLPDEIAEAQEVIDRSKSRIAEGEAEAARIVGDAKEHATELAKMSEVVRVAEKMAAKIKADAEAEAEALRQETDAFIDARMASFESVLHKTTSQVRTARQRLADRSGLDSAPTLTGLDSAPTRENAIVTAD